MNNNEQKQVCGGTHLGVGLCDGAPQEGQAVVEVPHTQSLESRHPLAVLAWQWKEGVSGVVKGREEMIGRGV